MGKKLVALVLSLVLCFAIAAPIALASTTSYVKLPSTMGGLNVRSGAGTSYDVAGWAVNGDEIKIIDAGSTWSKITVVRSGKSGYIKNAYIKDAPSAPSTPTPPSTPPTSGTATAGRVTANSLNMRKGPGTSYASVGSISGGTKLKLWDASGNWYYVTTLAGKSGWISKSYVATGYTMVTNASVNMRKSANGDVIRTLGKGTTVSVQSITGSWSKVKVGSTIGYLYNQYLK